MKRIVIVAVLLIGVTAFGQEVLYTLPAITEEVFDMNALTNVCGEQNTSVIQVADSLLVDTSVICTAAATTGHFSVVSWLIADGMLTNTIKEMAAEGHICAVLGHNWRDGRPGEGEGSPYGGWYADYHPNTYYRTCRTCKKCESQGLTSWE